MPEGKCPGDCPAENGTHASQPKARPAADSKPKSSWSVSSMWKSATKQGSAQNAKALADRKDQTAKLKNE